MNSQCFLVGGIMGCKHKIIKTEHPTSGACRYIDYCTKYKIYCLNNKGCKKDTKYISEMCRGDTK